MGNRKDIGKLFNERFKDFEQAPDAGLWDTIASELDQTSDRRIAPFWFYFGGVLLLGMLTGLWFWQPWNSSTPITNENQQLVVDDATNPENNTTNTNTTNDYIVNSTTLNTKETLSSTETNTTQPSITEKENSNTIHNRSTNNTTAGVSSNGNNLNKTQSTLHSNNPTALINSKSTSTNYSSKSTGQSSVISDQESLLEVLRSMKSSSQIAKEQKELAARDTYQAKIGNELAQAIAVQKEESKIAAQKWFDSIANIEALRKEALAAKAREASKKEEKLPKLPKLPKTEEEREKDRKESTEYKLALSPYTSILSYGSLTKGSSIDNRLVDNPRDAVGTVGYGIRADYKFTEKSSLRFGIGLAPLQYRTSDFQVQVTSNGNVNVFQLSGINPQNLEQGGGVETSPEALAFFNNNDVVSIEQDISYIEIPIDYQYRFLNKRVSLSFNSGLSLFVLTNNRVFATADNGQSIFIGRETSLKDLSLALNLGLGTHYNFSKRWRFDVEPAFKYQLNPYTDNIGNFKPYYFGLQFGMSYKF